MIIHCVRIFPKLRECKEALTSLMLHKTLK